MTQVDRRDSLASIRAAIHRKAARTREDHDVNSLVSDFGFLSVLLSRRLLSTLLLTRAKVRRRHLSRLRALGQQRDLCEARSGRHN